MNLPKPIANLINALERLPGIGPKTAARLTFYLLHVPQDELDFLASSVVDLKKKTVECSRCHNVDVKDPCNICSSTEREREIICVVEDVLDVLTIERSGEYRGLYHVLHGLIDPLNNVRPEDLRISQLLERLENSTDVAEIILATNPSAEGETTAMFIKRRIGDLPLKSPLKLSRLARGLPSGADIEYADKDTITRSLNNRTVY
jgi:recombination protein RecR